MANNDAIREALEEVRAAQKLLEQAGRLQPFEKTPTKALEDDKKQEVSHSDVDDRQDPLSPIPFPQEIVHNSDLSPLDEQDSELNSPALNYTTPHNDQELQSELLTTKANLKKMEMFFNGVQKVNSELQESLQELLRARENDEATIQELRDQLEAEKEKRHRVEEILADFLSSPKKKPILTNAVHGNVEVHSPNSERIAETRIKPASQPSSPMATTGQSRGTNIDSRAEIRNASRAWTPERPHIITNQTTSSRTTTSDETALFIRNLREQVAAREERLGHSEKKMFQSLHEVRRETDNSLDAFRSPVAKRLDFGSPLTTKSLGGSDGPSSIPHYVSKLRIDGGSGQIDIELSSSEKPHSLSSSAE